MVKITVRDRDGSLAEFDNPEGGSLMQALRGQGYEAIQAICGGCRVCGTCHIFVDPAWLVALPPQAEEEDILLDGWSSRAENSRLACQIPFDGRIDGLKLEIPPAED